MRRVCLLSACIGLMTILPLFSSIAQAVELQAQTVDAWKHYVTLTEARIDSELNDKSRFLVTEFISQKDAAECHKEVAQGDVCIKELESRENNGKKVNVPKGTISHWLGSVRIPNADLDTLITFVQSYDIHERYFGDVEQSELMDRDGDNFKFFYRLKQETAWVTVHYNTTHEITYRRHSPRQVSSASRTTRIHELDKPGTDEEQEKPEGNDNGFMWRLNSYWRLQQDEDGVVVTLESLTLSRGIPWYVSFVKPIVNKISRGLLENTLLTLRSGYHAYLQEVEQAVVNSDKTSPEALIVDLSRYVLEGNPDRRIKDPEIQKTYYYCAVGLIAQNVYLFAASHGLASWFHNCDKTNTVTEFKLRPDQRILFAQTVGYPT